MRSLAISGGRGGLGVWRIWQLGLPQLRSLQTASFASSTSHSPCAHSASSLCLTSSPLVAPSA